METPTDLEAKYHKLAAEYSKIRSQATVLKKAVLDEQAKNSQLKDVVKEREQKLRKHAQEMDSLTFRNEQLTKRISVLQQDLQNNTHGKKNKNKQPESTVRTDFSVLDEELHKKILENAQLVSTMADKELELSDNKDKIQWLEDSVTKLQKEISDTEERHRKELEKLQREKSVTSSASSLAVDGFVPDSTSKNSEQGQGETSSLCNVWQQEAERWRMECELLRAKPDSNENLTEYYESQIRDLLESKQMGHSEASSLWAENTALNSRLEQLILEKNELENSVDKSMEDLRTTNDNYRSQLDAMTEHLAAQNEKITKQCDEIQFLKHKLNIRK